MRTTLLAFALAIFAACSSKPPGDKNPDGPTPPGGPTSGSDMTTADMTMVSTTGTNTVPMIVDSGPTGAMYASYNVPYISVKICAPGSTTNCQTIDHVSVDTGSTGMHILASVINASVLSALPAEKSGSNTLTECYTYADGFVYGSVRTADLYIGGESALAMPFMAMGDPEFASSIPSNCSSSGQEEDTLDTFGANGIIGIGLYNPDCGTECTTVSGQGGPYYYACPASGACTATGVPEAQQLPNPVAKFATDNNGVQLQLPTISDSGALTATGTLIFGIGTQANNALSGETVYEATNDGNGTVTTTFNGKSIAFSFFDSGSTDLTFADSSIPQCSGDLQSYDCPTTTQMLSAMITGTGGTGTGTLNFKVANTMTTLAFDTSNDTAFDDIADQQSFGFPAFDWGLSVFYGRNMFFAIAGASTPNGTGPYFAF